MIFDFLGIALSIILIAGFIFLPFYFAKKFGSKLAFLSMGYGVLILLLFSLLFLIYPAGNKLGSAYFALLLLIVGGPGYIILSSLIYFFWPVRFEPKFGDSMDGISKFKQLSYFVWLACFIVLAVGLTYISS